MNSRRINSGGCRSAANVRREADNAVRYKENPAYGSVPSPQPELENPRPIMSPPRYKPTEQPPMTAERPYHVHPI
ncbi:MAG: hypothetical protein CM1200mP22_11080 [Dehalococcoidia bacterium]|nr:MAG: hypothetical protein CM1200mP22_11080 [Dehalococcoidia bacterium]